MTWRCQSAPAASGLRSKRSIVRLAGRLQGRKGAAAAKAHIHAPGGGEGVAVSDGRPAGERGGVAANAPPGGSAAAGDGGGSGACAVPTGGRGKSSAAAGAGASAAGASAAVSGWASAPGGGTGTCPFFSAPLICAARHAAYFCLASSSAAGSPNCASTCRKQQAAYSFLAVLTSAVPDRSAASALPKIFSAKPSMYSASSSARPALGLSACAGTDSAGVRARYAHSAARYDGGAARVGAARCMGQAARARCGVRRSACSCERQRGARRDAPPAA
jgi:hypothetical protein